MAVTMRAAIRFDLSFVVNLANDDVRIAIREHDDAEGDAAQASVIEARERVHAMIAKSLGHAFDVDEVNVRDVVMSDVCEACENNPGEYETGSGRSLCPACVHRVLAYRVVLDVLNNVGDYDVPLARAIAILDDDDEVMRNSRMPYVDSLSSGWDMLRGESHDEARAYVNDIGNVVVNATRNPGDVL